MNIIIAGIQGSGKGTHGKNLANHFNVPHISFGDALHKHLTENTGIASPYTLSEYNSGNLASDDVLFKVANDELKPSRVKKGFVLDGFPRTAPQHQYLVNNFLIDVCVVLEIPEEVTIRRLMKRGRADDTVLGIRKRIEQFREQTEPVFAYYERTGNLIRVNTNQSSEESFQEILKKN